MRAGRLRRGGFVLIAFALCAVPAAAQAPPLPSIWYRASAECPLGADFLAKLSDGAPRARLAEAGDHIDFVVTLQTANGQSVGRLERQTVSGTVAIRELRDATCTQVAEGLALSLGLALDPRSEASALPSPDASTLPAPAATAQTPPAAQPPTPVQAQAAVLATRDTSSDEPRPSKPASAETARGRATSVGLNAGGLSGLSSSLLLSGQAFVNWDRVLPPLANDFSLRLGVVGAIGSTSTAVGAVKRWVLGARAEACPFRLGSAHVGFRPCLGFEVGVTGASDARATGLNDRALWAAPSIAGRVEVAVTTKLALEAGVGALLPLQRERLFAGTQQLYRDDFVALQASLGLSLRLP
jgi:hypothetical protein